MSFADTIARNGFQGKLIYDLMLWNGDGNVHRVSRYNSTDTVVIANQIALMKLAGAKGVRVTWEGPSHTYIHQAAMEVCNQCIAQNMLFSILINPQVNGQILWWDDPGFLEMVTSSAYIPEKWLCDFSTGIDYTKVTLPSGFSILLNQKGFNFVNAYNGDNTTSLNQLITNNKLITMIWPFVSVGFNDAGVPTPSGVSPVNFTGTRDYSQGVWSSSTKTLTPRAIDHQAGNFFLDSIGALVYCMTAPYVSSIWNDADEGAGVEHFMAMFFNVRLGQ